MSANSSRGSAWGAVRQAVLERDNWTCQHCGKFPLVGTDATADHIITKSAGGPDAVWNCIASCRPCNSKRQDKPILRRSGWASGWEPPGLSS